MIKKRQSNSLNKLKIREECTKLSFICSDEHES